MYYYGAKQRLPLLSEDRQRMRILVVGDGKVGHVLAEQLTQEAHDVVVIDEDEQVLQRTEDTLDVLCVRGNGANAKTLMNAGAAKA